MVEENYSIIYKRLIRRFIISLFILLSAFILKQFIVYCQIVHEENKSYVVYIADRQRMLSQKIKDISLIKLDQTTLDDELYRDDIEEILELWEKSHSELLALNNAESLFYNESSSINQMFVVLEPTFLSLKKEVKLFLKDMNVSGTEVTITGKQINTILLYESMYLKKMDLIVCTYEEEVRSSVKFFEVLHIFLLVIIVFTMIFIIFKIYIPLLNYLKNILHE